LETIMTNAKTARNVSNNSLKFNRNHTILERAEAQMTKDWLQEQEDAEVEALIFHMSCQNDRSMRLEAYDR
jgi:hypothetical protein